MDWIQGENFQRIADFIYSPEIKVRDDYNKIENTFDKYKLRSNSIIYTHTMYVQALFSILKQVMGNLKSGIIVITHNSDINVNGSFEIPNCVYKWYTTNVDSNNSKIESIPIGIENNRWMYKTDKKAIMLAQLKLVKHIKNLVYMNHNISTNPLKRLKLYQMFEDNYWVTSERGKNGSNFSHYISQIYNHQFVICPEGNGMDTHRMWECLYMGTIPIVKRSINNLFYKDLPICFVDDWDEVTKPFLLQEFKRLTNIQWDKEKLTQEYWNNKIKNSRL